MDVLEFFRALNPASVFARLLLAVLIGGAIGMERGRRGRAAGMRTHILVCIGAAITALVGLFASQSLGFQSDPLRVSAQVISGIGFLGAGMILVRGHFQITGLTTAAGLWATAAIGLAVGIGFYEVAGISLVLVLATNAILPKLERNVKSRRNQIYLELTAAEQVGTLVKHMTQEHRIDTFRIVEAKSRLPGYVGLEAELPTDKPEEVAAICESLSGMEGVAFAVEHP